MEHPLVDPLHGLTVLVEAAQAAPPPPPGSTPATERKKQKPGPKRKGKGKGYTDFKRNPSQHVPNRTESSRRPTSKELALTEAAISACFHLPV